MVLSHLAARTRNIRLGHGIVLLPFGINHPLRVAERIATLDLLSNGRVEFGGGRAISESELSGFGVDPDDTRPQWEESLKILPRMWTQENFQ
ncbi:MAG: LLM class flavin-dependent oxidoreductase, partial [Terriglobia bacterium]